MPAPTLTPQDQTLIAKAVDWYVREGVPEAHVRAIALGDVRDPEFEKMKDLRARLRALVQQEVVIGRHAYDYLTSVQWEDPTVMQSLRRVSGGKTRVTIAAHRETMALFAEVLQRQAEALLEEGSRNGNRLASKRLAVAAEQFAALAAVP